MRKVFIGIGLLVSVLGSTYVYTQARSYVRNYNSCDCVQPSRYVDAKERYVSQGCCADAKRRTRPFSDRIGAFRYRQPSRAKVERYALDLSHPSRRHDVWYHRQYAKAPADVTSRKKVALQRERYAHTGIYARAENTVPSNRHVIQRGNYRYKKGYPTYGGYGVNQHESYQKYKETGLPFSIDLQGLNLVRKGENTFSDRNSSLSFRISRGTECSNNNFRQCAVAHSRGFKNGQNLSSIQNLYAQTEYNTTVEHDGNKYPVYVEGFTADGYGTRNVYFVYTMLDPSNDTVVRIEAVALAHDINIASQKVYDIAQTFLFTPQLDRPEFIDYN